MEGITVEQHGQGLRVQRRGLYSRLTRSRLGYWSNLSWFASYDMNLTNLLTDRFIVCCLWQILRLCLSGVLGLKPWNIIAEICGVVTRHFDIEERIAVWHWGSGCRVLGLKLWTIVAEICGVVTRDLDIEDRIAVCFFNLRRFLYIGHKN